MGISMMRKRMPKAFLLFILLPLVASLFESDTDASRATDRFEVYCDGIGIFLANVDGAPQTGKLILFSSFPIGLAGILQENWSDTYVLPDGCVPDGKCKSIGKGKLWIDKWENGGIGTVSKQISGKYEVELNGKKLQGIFTAKIFSRKKPVRLCM